MGEGRVDVDAVGGVALKHQTHEVPDFLWRVAETPLLPEFSVTPPPRGAGFGAHLKPRSKGVPGPTEDRSPACREKRENREFRANCVSINFLQGSDFPLFLRKLSAVLVVKVYQSHFSLLRNSRQATF